MVEYKAPLRDMYFVLHEVFEAGKLWESLPEINQLIDTQTANTILKEGAKLAEHELAPINRSGDEEGVHFNNGNVTTPKGFIRTYKHYCEGGWPGLGGDPAYGGMGIPKMLSVHFEEMLYGANNAFTLYPILTAGACLALKSHASNAICETYLPKMYSGQWSGSMCLTEAHCGTDLGLIRTKAESLKNETYSITGTKIFITGGEHDLTENIIHLVLAKLPDAPSGSRGISLFLVSKFLLDDDNELGIKNNVSCGSIEHKMGIHASSTCIMNFDGAIGLLVGEKHKGLSAMFTMMNYERLSIGIQGIGCSEMSYQTALAYAKERRQGKATKKIKNQDNEADPIIEHPDIRRMLLNIKSTTEAGRAFSTYIAKQLDLVKYSNQPETQKKAKALVALLTPVGKAFFTDIGLDNCIQGQQILGGHGYIREWGQEQLVRDVRISQIYEGSNGIQALDLISRKIITNKCEFFNMFTDEIIDFIKTENQNIKGNKQENNLNINLISDLEEAVINLKDITTWIVKKTQSNTNEIGASAVDYLNIFGLTAYAYMWALMAKTASAQPKTDDLFYLGKLTTANFYFKKVLPRVFYLSKIIKAGSTPLFDLDTNHF